MVLNLTDDLFRVLVLEGANSTRLHSLEFTNFAMVLSDSQLELLASTLGIYEVNTAKLATHVRKSVPRRINLFMRLLRQTVGRNTALKTQPCTWNMLFSRRCVFHRVEWWTHLVGARHCLVVCSFFLNNGASVNV